MTCRPDVAAILLQRGVGKCLKMKKLLITIPVHKDRLSSLLSRPFAVLQMFFCRFSAVLHMSFSRSSCRPLLSFSRLSTYLQSFLLPSLCCPSVVPPPPFILLSAVSGQCSPTSSHDLTNKKPRRPSPVCRGVYGSKGECYSPLRFMRYL